MLPPGLSMLWESVDATSALTERFGFENFGAVSEWVASALASRWGIRVDACERIVISGPNAIVWVSGDRGDLVVKWSCSQPHFASLDFSTRLLRAVARQGLPVAVPLVSLEGWDRVVVDGPAGALSVTVLPELVGDWLDVDDHAAVRSAGACLARLHDALRTVESDGSAQVVDQQDLTAAIETWVATADPDIAPAALTRLKNLLPGLPDLDGEPQVVHNDFRAANVLTRDSMVVGVLDLDEVFVGHPVADLAKASTYLATMFRRWGPTTLAMRRCLREGYESVRPLSTPEAQWLEVLLLWQGIMAIPAGKDPDGWATAI